MTGNIPKLDLVNGDVHTKFGWILSISSQDIERKRNSDVNINIDKIKLGIVTCHFSQNFE